eukprot:SAG22_NODE_676_length_7962_cov_75.623681_1_plen_73_part_00
MPVTMADINYFLEIEPECVKFILNQLGFEEVVRAALTSLTRLDLESNLLGGPRRSRTAGAGRTAGNVSCHCA